MCHMHIETCTRLLPTLVPKILFLAEPARYRYIYDELFQILVQDAVLEVSNGNITVYRSYFFINGDFLNVEFRVLSASLSSPPLSSTQVRPTSDCLLLNPSPRFPHPHHSYLLLSSAL